ncbi:unnamed protein product [Calypogeia fissa]
MDHSASNGRKPTWVVSSCDVLFDGDAIRIDFVDAAFVFHSQWLHDAKCDTGPSRTAVTAYCSKPAGARIIEAHVGNAATTLEAKWQDESMSSFPAVWLRVHGPLVGKACSDKSPQQVKEPEGWLAATLRIPSVDYHDIFSTTEDRCSVVAEQVLDILPMSPETGIIKVTGLPSPDVECERRKINTLVTRVLKKLFGSVFQHSRRAAETTFNVASHRDEVTKRGDVLVNYNTTQPGTSAVKRFRWHAHLTGSLVTPFEDFPVARAAHQKLQEIMRRESHLLKVRLQPGDLYIWNNFTILHGRERVFETPRTGVGQTVPEQVVADRYRAIKMEAPREHLEEDWLIHMPFTLLYQMIELIKGY